MSNESIDDFEDFYSDMESSKYFKAENRQIRKAIKFYQGSIGTYVYAVAIHRNVESNKLIEIPSYGTAITTEVYDCVRDCFCVRCHNFFDLGYIPVNYYLIIKDIDSHIDMPLPFSVIKTYLSKEKLKSYNLWKKMHVQDCKIRFFQTLDCG